MRHIHFTNHLAVWKNKSRLVTPAQHSVLLLGFTSANRKRLEGFLNNLRKNWNIPARTFSNIVVCLSETVSNAVSQRKKEGRMCIFISARSEGPFFYFEVESTCMGKRSLADTYAGQEPGKKRKGTYLVRCLSDMFYFSGAGECLTMAFIKENNLGPVRFGS